MKKLITSDRRNRIVEEIISNRGIKTSKLAEDFGVSIETIRKDLIYLDKIGAVKKSRGGGLSPLELMEKPLQDRNITNYEEKNLIAQEANKLIKPDSVIFIDSGSTTLCLAKLLYLQKGLTIITNSIGAMNVLVNNPDNKIYITGGEVSSIAMSLEGLGATNFLKEVKIDISFLGSSGFKHHDGPTSKNFYDADIKKTVINNSSLNVVLADGTKSRTTAFVKYTSWNNIDYLISDNKIEHSSLELVKKFTNVLLV